MEYQYFCPSYRFLRLWRWGCGFPLRTRCSLGIVALQVANTFSVLPPESHQSLQVLQTVLVLGVQPNPVLLPLVIVQSRLDAHAALAPRQGWPLGRATSLPHHQHGGAADQSDRAGTVVVAVKPTITSASVSMMVGSEHIIELLEHPSKRTLTCLQTCSYVPQFVCVFFPCFKTLWVLQENKPIKLLANSDWAVSWGQSLSGVLKQPNEKQIWKQVSNLISTCLQCYRMLLSNTAAESGW